MLKKILIGGLIVILAILVGGFFWVRSVLGGDGVRIAIAAQISKAIGQPVTIGRISATAYPRVTVNLGDVRIGSPARVQVSSLVVGTDFRALLSRRIEHASLRLNGARIDLPLPPFTTLSSTTPQTEARPLVELVSIDEIVLRDVNIVSGKRTLRGDVEVVPQGNALVIRRIALGAGDTKVTVTGRISDLAGPVGDIKLKAGTLNVDDLMAFATDFSSGSGLAASPSSPRGAAGPAARTAGPSRMNLTIALDADRATMGQLALEKFSGRARITAQDVTLDPIAFGIFGGRYEGSLVLTPAASGRAASTQSVRARAKLTGVDVAAATRFAGTPDTMSGRMSGQLEFSGRGEDAAALTNSAHGTLRVDVTDGIVKHLGLVNAVVVATSMRSGALSNAASGSKDEPFSRLGATLAIAGGAVTTNDLMFEGNDLSLAAQGALQLSAATLDLKGKVQLSDALSQQAGQDLLRYTQEQGRVTLPATISGPAVAPSVRIDVGDMTKRAIKNAVASEAGQQKIQEVQQKAKDKLSDLLKR